MTTPELAEDLRRLAADYVAGDLSGDQRRAFEAALAASPMLRDEVAFWRSALADLPVAGRHGSGPRSDLLERVRSGVSQRRPPIRVQIPAPMLRVVTTLLAAGLVAAFVAGVVASGREAHRDLAWDESGHAWRPGSAQAAVVWLGLWTRPISAGQAGPGLEVVRVVEDGPAWRGGLRPGDIILAAGGSGCQAPSALSQRLAELGPGAPLELSVVSVGDQQIRRVELALGRVIE